MKNKPLGKVINIYHTNKNWEIICDNAIIRITPYSEKIVRFTIIPSDESFHDMSYAVVLKPVRRKTFEEISLKTALSLISPAAK